jgi:hypothetical protein
MFGPVLPNGPSTPIAAPQFDLSAVLMDRREEPQFDAKKSRIFKILAGLAALGGDSYTSSGILQGSANALNQMQQDFLASQDQVRSHNQAIDQFNLGQEQAVNEALFDADQYRLGALRKAAQAQLEAQIGRESTRFETDEKLRAKMQEIEYLRSLPLTDEQQAELREIESRIKENEAQARSADALGRYRDRNYGRDGSTEQPKFKRGDYTTYSDTDLDRELRDANLELKAALEKANDPVAEKVDNIEATRRIQAIQNRIVDMTTEKQRRSSGATDSPTDKGGDLSGLPQSAIDAGFTAEEWKYLTPEQQAEFK